MLVTAQMMHFVLDGSELGAKILGEGGNLGATQLGRIEFAATVVVLTLTSSIT